MWRQRSGVNWLKERDLKHKFFLWEDIYEEEEEQNFHIKKQKGEWIHDREGIERMANNYFTELFSTSNPSGINEALEAMTWKIDQEMAIFLDLPFTQLEIKEALFQIGSTKALGPDSMLALFYQKHWYVVVRISLELSLRY